MRKGKGRNSKLLPNSLRIISSCIRTVSTNASTAVRSAGASVAASISSSANDRKEQVLWAGFDKLELSPTAFRRVLLLGYVKGFQVFDVEDASRLSELVSRRDGPVSFLQMLPAPSNLEGSEKNKLSHPILVIVGGGEDDGSTTFRNTRQGPARYGSAESSFENFFDPPSVVRFYSMKSNDYVKVIDFQTAVLMVRCSSRVVAIGIEEKIYCFDPTTLEKKFVVITYPVPGIGEQGAFGINTGYGPLAVGPRWLAYPPYRPFLLNTGRVSPQSLASSVSPSSSPGSGSLMARYAMESSKHLAAGILTLGDMGYKKLSKYYPELLPDGPSSPGRRGGKLAASESENAGWIAVKDLVSLEVITQFRAHSSPISALCFDPSGTLLVTASVCGNNINIFRIMPSHSCSGPGSSDWSNSYVHLYKMHRGFTTAIIQDICFSQYSQWIAVVSSRGTCHIFILSPFGGDDGLQALSTCGQGTSLFLAVTPPWWSTSSLTTSEQNFSPPPPCTLSVAIRIKSSDSSWLNSVSNAAASLSGKIWVPSGAVAATFHNSSSAGSLDINSTVRPLEHILVYTPSGFVVQHEIQLSGLEWSGNRTESWPASQVNPQNEELKVKFEPIQWWDVCRRLDNLEREECITGSMFDVQNDSDIDDNTDAEEKKLVKSDSFKSPEKNWHMSKAEVQINSCRAPLWQKLKIHFHSLDPSNAERHVGEEFEIERTPSHEIEIRQKNLLPAINFTSARSGLINRSIPSEGNYPGTSSGSFQTRDNNEAVTISQSKPPSFSSTQSSEGGSSRRIEGLLDLERMNIGSHKASLMDQRSTSEYSCSVGSVVDKTTMSRSCPTGHQIPVPSRTEKKVDLGQLFNEGYCTQPEKHDHGKPTEVATNEVDTGANDQEENPDDEGWSGGMFDFSEEG